MKTRVGLLATATLFTLALTWTTLPGRAQESNVISGVVTSSNGPEEGVWVIAETDSLATRLVKTVVTGDGGRFLIPELPEASYQVWVRGYASAEVMDRAGSVGCWKWSGQYRIDSGHVSRTPYNASYRQFVSGRTSSHRAASTSSLSRARLRSA